MLFKLYITFNVILNVCLFLFFALLRMSAESDYRPGNIISLTLSNFQTYDYAHFKFCPKLNFIAGPNGSGKSTVSNAIAFIFGGTTKVIGKSKDLSDFVKSQKSIGYVEAEVKIHDNRIVKIKRILKSDSNTSHWYIDGQQVKITEISKLINSLKIDVNNLCNFLPQEKVSEFSKYSSEELLVKVIESQESKDLLIIRNSLIELETNLEQVTTKITSMEENKKGLERIINHLSKDAAKIEEKKEKARKIDLLKIKKEFLIANIYQKKYKEERQRAKEIETQLQEIYAEIKKYEDEIKELEKDEKVKENSKCRDELRKDTEILQNKTHDIRKMKHEKDLLKVEFKNLEKNHQKLKEKKERIKLEIQELLSKIEKITIKTISDENYPTQKEIDAIEESLADKTRKLGEIRKISQNIQNEIEELTRKKNYINEEENRRLENLKKYHWDTYKAICWLRNNKNLFEEEIIEPLYLSLSLKDNRYLKEVETFLSFQTLTSFMCKNKKDFESFTMYCKDKLKLGINSIELKGKIKEPNISREKIKTLGFDGYLLDFVEGSEEVLTFLCVFGYFHAIPVTKRNLNEEELFKKYNFSKMAVNGKYHEIKKSRYNSEYTTITSDLHRKNIFNTNIVVEELKKIDEILEQKEKLRIENSDKSKKEYEQINDIKQDLNNLYKKRAEYQTLVAEVRRQKERKKSYLENLEELKKEFEQIKNNNELKTIEKELTKKENKILEIEANYVLELKEELKSTKIFEICKKGFENELERIQLFTKIQKNKESILLEEQKTNSLKNEENEIKEKIIEIKNILNEKKAILRNIEITQKDKDEMSTYTNVIEEIDKEVAAETARLSFYTGDENVITEFKTKENLLKELIENKTTIEGKENAIKSKINNYRKRLITALENILEPINERFKDYFGRLGYEGKLQFDNTPVAKQWKLQILVKFRKNESFEVLSSSRQSGGEKSVSTILFILSLFDSTSSPFRLVDEINQGMDRFNEKKMHNLLVSLTENPSSPQFFIITPKIIEGLNFSKSMKIIIIFPGKFSSQTQDRFNNYKTLS
ncbi:SMC family protein, partial [Spraguea lophii 42_110]